MAQAQYHYKVVSADSQELDNCLLIDKIDSSMSYHIGRPLVVRADKQNRTLRYAHGGASLDKLTLSMELDYQRFLPAFTTIFEGVYHMNSRNFYHLDIKLANITMQKDYTFRFIDFGISGKNVPRVIFCNVYVIWPYETCLLAKDPPSPAEGADRLSRYTNDSYFLYYSRDFPQANLAQAISDNYHRLKAMAYTERNRLIYSKLDVYSLGIVLDGVIRLLRMPPALKEALQTLKLSMTDIRTAKRCTPLQALQRYRTIVNSIKNT